MDPAAPVTVVKGTLALGTVTTAYAALVAVAQSQNPFAFGINGAIGGGTVGLSYFALREYVISPLLVSYLPLESYTLRRDILSHARASLRSSPKVSVVLDSSVTHDVQDLRIRESTDKSIIRWNKLLDSGLAGGITGGWVGWWAKRYRGMAVLPSRSAIQLGALTASLQFVINNARILRLDYLASQVNSSEPEVEASKSASLGLVTLIGGDDGTMSQSERKSLGDVMEGEKRNWPLKGDSLRTAPAPDVAPRQSDRSENQSPIPAATPAKPSLASRMTDYLSSLSPIRRLSDVEYRTILLTQRSELLSQLSHARSLSASERAAAEKEEREKEGWLGGLVGIGPGNGESELERQLDMVRGKLEGLEERMGRAGSKA